MATVQLDPSSVADYQRFMAIKALPSYRISGRTATFPDEYAERIGVVAQDVAMDTEYNPPAWMFDYQRAITSLAIQKRRYCLFVDCGYGKTAIFLEFARYAREALAAHKRVLIVSPLMVIPQTMDEAARFFPGMPVERVDAKHLRKWLHGTGGIGITNYDAIRDDLERGNLGCLILDECFAPDTMIDTTDESRNRTQTRIDNILPGDTIHGAIGDDLVLAVKKREVPYAVIVDAGQKVTCSPNHPWFTQRGWVCAQDLEPGDSILSTVAAVRMVRGGVCPEGHEGAGEVLRSILLSEVENVDPSTLGKGTYGGGSEEAGGSEEGVVRCGESGGGKREEADCFVESYVESGYTGESIRNPEADGPPTFRAWGQWDWDDFTAEDIAGCVGGTMGCGTSFVVGPAASGISHTLQARLSKYRTESVYRGGWVQPSLTEDGRPEEGCESDFARVAGVEVLEPGHPELERLRAADGKLYFYDLEAERHPSYSVGGLLVHNSSMLKSHYGKWGTKLLDLGRGVEWKMAATGTPAPNDRIEYANHAVFMDAFPNVNAFLARFFVNRGQTQERWALKPHALRPFYTALSHWCIFMTNPATYGWHDNAETIPPIHIHEHDVPMTAEQQRLAFGGTGDLFAHRIGGITNRSVLSQIAKGCHKGQRIETYKPGFIREMVDSWPDESTIIWCRFNAEQEILAKEMPHAASIKGKTPDDERQRIVYAFKRGEIKTLITKPKILGFGMNLQVATRQIFSACDDSYEEFYQAVKRSNRVGSVKPLNVHLPVTDIERMQMENVMRKASMVQRDTEVQERLFKESGYEVR
jgi:superfamily II DNA or RNA helicase